MILRAIFAFLAWSAIVVPPPQKGQSSFSLTISTPQQSVISGAEVRLDIALKNTSDREIVVRKLIGDYQGELSYTIGVRDATGAPAADTAFGRFRKDPGDKHHPNVAYGSGFQTALKSGESLNDVAIITRLYDLTMPGKYSIQVSRQLPPEWGGGTLESNTIIITVTQ